MKGAITDSVNCHQIITLKNEENEIVMDNLVFHLIELGKFSIAKTKISHIQTEKEELFYTMKYAHQFDPFKSPQPKFWEKDFFKAALQRLDTSKMSPMEVAAYENALMRVQTVANKQQQNIEEAILETKIEGIKKLLLSNKLSKEEISEYMAVSMDFVEKIQKSLPITEKIVKKPRAKKAKKSTE